MLSTIDCRDTPTEVIRMYNEKEELKNWCDIEGVAP